MITIRNFITITENTVYGSSLERCSPLMLPLAVFFVFILTVTVLL